MRYALLQLGSGKVAERIPLPEPEPAVIEHGGRRWVRSHNCLSGVAYALERPRVSNARRRVSEGPRWVMSRKRTETVQE